MSQILSKFSGLFARTPSATDRSRAPAQGDGFDRLGRIVSEERARDGRPLPRPLTMAQG